MRKFLSLLSVLVCITALTFGQTRTVSGQVHDNNGKAIPFATVKVKGGKGGVAADANGNFKIDVKPDAILEVSAAGFQTTDVSVGTSVILSVDLKGLQNLQEVVVTALGIQRAKNTLPYSVQQVTGSEVSQSRGTNFASNLSGKVAGLDIKQANTLGGSTNIVLRGQKSIMGTNQALIVVDGVPYDNTSYATTSTDQRTGRGGYDYGNVASDINPDDIASISILKGAAASALYGSRGFNGVILITTKKAHRGLGITVNSGATLVEMDKSTFPTYQKKYGGGYGQYYEDPSGFFLYRDINGDGTKDLVDPTSEDASYGAAFDPSLMVYQWDAFDSTSPYYGKARPWMAAAHDPSYFFQKPVNFNNSIFITGGNEKATFKLGYTRNDDKGILPNSKIVKNALTASTTLNITDKLTATADFNYTRTDGLGRYGTGYDDKNPMASFRQWWQVNNDILEQKDAYFRTGRNITWNWADPSDLEPIYWDNWYFTRYENYESDYRNRFFGYTSLNYKATDWLNLMGRVSLDSYNGLEEERAAIGTVGVPGYTRKDIDYHELNFDFLATLNKDLSSSLNLKALAGTNLRKTIYSTILASTNGGLVVPRLYSLQNSANPVNAPEEYYSDRQVGGVFAGATLTYKEFLILDGTIRRDQSSTLPASNNSYYYPSVSGGFVFSHLLKNLSWLSYGKLRANYAEVGNDAPAYDVTDTYNWVPFFGSQTLYATATTKNNPDLKPERTKSYEAGLELSFLQSRLGLDVTYYDAKTVDQIIPVAVSRATGYDAKIVNAGTVENKGIELSLNAEPVKTRDFSWDLNVNWSRNRNKVVDLYEGVDNIQLGSFQGGVTINATKGQPYGTIRGTDFVYLNGQKEVGSNGRYLITSAANIVIGDPNPDWIGGISNSFRYKDFTLSFLVDVRHGGQLFSLDMYYGLATGLYPETAGLNDLGNPLRAALSDGGGIIRPGVTADGKANDIRVSAVNFGAYGYRYSPDAGFIYDASYVKLRQAALSYDLPSSVISKMKVFKGIGFSLVGRNLWIIHKNLPYSDPEDSYGAGNLQGYQGNAYPSTRSIAFNVKLSF